MVLFSLSASSRFSEKSPREKDNNQIVSLEPPWHNFSKVAWIKGDMGEKNDSTGWPRLYGCRRLIFA